MRRGQLLLTTYSAIQPHLIRWRLLLFNSTLYSHHLSNTNRLDFPTAEPVELKLLRRTKVNTTPYTVTYSILYTSTLFTRTLNTHTLQTYYQLLYINHSTNITDLCMIFNRYLNSFMNATNTLSSSLKSYSLVTPLQLFPCFPKVSFAEESSFSKASIICFRFFVTNALHNGHE